MDGWSQLLRDPPVCTAARFKQVFSSENGLNQIHPGIPFHCCFSKIMTTLNNYDDDEDHDNDDDDQEEEEDNNTDDDDDDINNVVTFQ